MRCYTIGDLGAEAAPPEEFKKLVAGWPPEAAKRAAMLIKKYGAPQGAMPDRLVWVNPGVWRETIVYRDGTPHAWPMPHMDYIEQSINYRTPVQAFTSWAMFDGSVHGERTRGRLAATCDNEPMNFLAINLANDIATGQRDPKEARYFYENTARAYKAGKRHSYTEGFVFPVSKQYMGDPDVRVF